MLRHEPGRILITAHRGVSGANIPCNTRTAFDIALAQGADILELDVARSRDGQLFVFHPGMEKPHLGIDCSLSELSAAEIKELRFLNQDNVPTSYGIVPLEEMFAHLRDKAYINVDKFWMWMEEITHVTRKGNSPFTLTNTNKLLRNYEGCDGLKTGSTSMAKYCLSATAVRNGIRLISVIMTAPDSKTRFNNAAELLNYGYGRCSLYQDLHEQPLKPLLK